MARARSPDSIEAEKMYRSGMKLVEIAEKLGVPDGTVRRWKSTQKWEGSGNGKSERSEKKKASVRKPGPPKGNKNAVGAGAPKRNKNAEKHGAFTKVYFDTLDEDEQDLINSMDEAEEEQLIIQLQTFSIRERRFMHSIKKYREMEAKNHGLSIKAASKTKKVEDLTDFEEESVGSGKFKKVTETSVTNTEPVMNSIVTLEAELTKIQRAKTRTIETLAKLHLEKQKLEVDTSSNDVVKAWTEKVLKARREQRGQ